MNPHDLQRFAERMRGFFGGASAAHDPLATIKLGPAASPVEVSLSGSATLAPAAHFGRRTLTDSETVTPGGAQPLRPVSAPLEPGRHVRASQTSSFRITEVLGQGGGGIVHGAVQENLGRIVALKTVLRSAQTESKNRQFLTESRVTGTLDHPNIVPIYDLTRTAQGDLLLAMKLISGRSWEQFLRESPEKIDEHLQILLTVGNALAFAHSRGVVHCDIKPQNVMIGSYGEVYVVDWGIASPITSRDAPPGEEPAPPKGTPAYMAPELALGDPRSISPKTDVFLLGGVLYRIISGRPPHTANDLFGVLKSAAECRPPSFPEGTPEELRGICARALARDPNQRHGSVKDFQAAIKAFLSHRDSNLLVDNARARVERWREALRGDSGRPLSKQRRGELYSDLAEAIAIYGQAQELWRDNPLVGPGRHDARLSYAAAALKNGDLGLAENQIALLDQDESESTRLREDLNRAVRWKKTRTILLVSLAISVFSLVAAVAIIYVLYSSRLEEQRRVAVRSQRLSEARLAESLSALELLGKTLQDELQFVANTQVRTARVKVLKQAITMLERARKPQLSMEAAEWIKENDLTSEKLQTQMLIFLASYSREVEELDKAAAYADQAVSLSERLWEKDPTEGELVVLYVRSLRESATLARVNRDFDQCHKFLVRAQNALQKLPPEQATRDPYLHWVLVVGNELGDILEQRGQLIQALEQIKQVLEIRKERARNDPADHYKSRDYATSLARTAKLYMRMGKDSEALKLFRKAVEKLKPLAEANAYDTLISRNLGSASLDIIEIHMRAERWEEARAEGKKAIAMAQSLLSADENNADMARILFLCITKCASIFYNTGDVPRARQGYTFALDQLKRFAAKDSTSLELKRDYVTGWNMVGKCDLRLGNTDAAIKIFEGALTFAEDMVKAQPNDILALDDRIVALMYLGKAYVKAGDTDKALEYYSAAEDRLREFGLISPNSEVVQRRSAELQRRLAKITGARR